MNDFIQKIDTSKLTETDLLIYEYIKENASKIPWMTLEDLCQVLFVSNASIVRFCQHVGLKGFNELKFVLRNDSRVSHNPIYEIIPGQLASFNDLLSSVSQEDTEKLCNMIKSHNTVYIYGRNLSSIPATYFYDMLMSIDIPCILIDWMDALASIAESVDNNTLLILISDHAHEEYFPIIETLKQKHAFPRKEVFLFYDKRYSSTSFYRTENKYARIIMKKYKFS